MQSFIRFRPYNEMKVQSQQKIQYNLSTLEFFLCLYNNRLDQFMYKYYDPLIYILINYRTCIRVSNSHYHYWLLYGPLYILYNIIKLSVFVD